MNHDVLPPLHGEGRSAKPIRVGKGEAGLGLDDHILAMITPDMQPVQRACEMRRSMTPPEARMWVALRKLRAEGFHSRRQAPFRGYFLDVVCHAARLVVEVDGQSHEAAIEHDELRDMILAKQGYLTLRFTNATVRDDLGSALTTVRRALAARLPHPVVATRRHPSP